MLHTVTTRSAAVRLRFVVTLIFVLGLAAAACRQPNVAEPAAPDGVATARGDATVRLFFAGDLMLGRGVGAVVDNDPLSLFGDVRHDVSAADVAMANLESPFGDAAPTEELRLVADPKAASLVAAAGFDVLAVANNHAGDGGPESVADSVRTIESNGMSAIGVATAGSPLEVATVEVRGVVMAMLAFDLTRQGPAPGESDGVTWWDPEVVRAAVEEARAGADVVTVSLHGGVEYLAEPDPALRSAADAVAGWGADVVWAHGAHHTYEVTVLDPDGDGRSTVVAYGLGNFLFDQRIAGTEEGLVLEVVASAGGIVVHRVGKVSHADLRVSPIVWSAPHGDAVALGGEWWQLTRSVRLAPQPPSPEVPPELDAIGAVAAVAWGDVDGDGSGEFVAAFRRPFRPTLVNQRFSAQTWTDPEGLSAHLGVFADGDLAEEWVAGTLRLPIDALAVCDSGVAVSYEQFARPGSVAAGAWHWEVFGFALAPDLPGRAIPGCADVDLDGSTDPVLLRDGG